MRLTIVCLALLALSITSCRKDAPPAKEHDVNAPPKINLLEVGTPPLRKLRWRFKKGQKQTVNIERTLAVSARAGEGVAPRTPGPTYKFEIELEAKSVSDDGTTHVAFIVNKADAETEHASKGLTKDLQEQHAVGVVRGLRGRYRIAPSGIISHIEIDAPPDASHRTHQAIETVRLALLYMTIPLPDEEVGVDSKWTVTGPAKQFEIEVDRQLTVEVAKFNGNKVGLNMIVNHAGTQQSVTSAGTPSQVFELMVLMDQSMGDGMWNLGKLAPSKMETAEKNHMKIRNPGINGEIREMETLRETTLSIRSK